ncbi:MAG TPA: dienelactone hydrolase family protein [Candidatus Angelobacter sp.]|nr:dienelactone hydrolase family protein [Candidatus Angelobacter sp.]
MCHDDDSRPPSPPVVGEVASQGLVTLTAADGNAFAAYQAVPAAPNGRNVVILPDVRGLHPYYEALAVRFAEAGFHAVAFDYFGRTQGVGRRPEGFDWQSEVKQLTPEMFVHDTRAAADHVRSLNAGPTFTVGFCMGGSHSWRMSATDIDLAGCVGFYGRPPLVADVEDAMRTPLLMLVGSADAATPLADFEALDARLTERGLDHEMYVYDGAPHSFFDRAFAEWRPACDDAWRRILAFTERLG